MLKKGNILAQITMSANNTDNKIRNSENWEIPKMCFSTAYFTAKKIGCEEKF